MPPADHRIQRHPTHRGGHRAPGRVLTPPIAQPYHRATVIRHRTGEAARASPGRDTSLSKPAARPPTPASPTLDAAGPQTLPPASEPNHLARGENAPLCVTLMGAPTPHPSRRPATAHERTQLPTRRVVRPPNHPPVIGQPRLRHTEERRPSQPPQAHHSPQRDTHRPPPVSL